MRNISNSNRSDSYGETSWESGDASEASSGENSHQDLVREANSVPLFKVFRLYKISASPTNTRIVCPFKFHKNGRERTGSFNYYPHTNSFHCFGCGTGGSCSEFVAAMDNINKHQAALKIISLFEDSVNEIDLQPFVNLNETLEIAMEFSNMVREFRQEFFDEKSTVFIEEICEIYDKLYARHNSKHKIISNEALRRIVERLKGRINYYKSCLTP